MTPAEMLTALVEEHGPMDTRVLLDLACSKGLAAVAFEGLLYAFGTKMRVRHPDDVITIPDPPVRAADGNVAALGGRTVAVDVTRYPPWAHTDPSCHHCDDAPVWLEADGACWFAVACPACLSVARRPEGFRRPEGVRSWQVRVPVGEDRP